MTWNDVGNNRAAGDHVVVNTGHEFSSGRSGDNINVEDTDDIVIEGFIVRDADRAGIRVVHSARVVVMNNRSGPNGRWGIFTGFAPGIRILGNETFGSEIEHGIYHSNSDTSEDDFVICGNDSHSNGTNGIQLNGDCNAGGDGMLEDGLIAANTVHDNDVKGLSIIAAPGLTIVNNVIYNNGLQAGAGGIHLTNEPGCPGSLTSSDVVVVNNTVVEPNIAGIRITDGSRDNVVFNNIFVSRRPAADEVGASDIGADNVLQESDTGLAFAEGYRLRPESSAVNRGVANYRGYDAPDVDIVGTPRPQQGDIDLGAYEMAAQP